MRIRLVGCLMALAIVGSSLAQTGPGGVGNSSTNVLWLSADNGVFSDGGVTPASNGNNVGQWNDRSGNGRNASHATVAERPNYQTGVVNGLPAIRFTAASGDRLLSSGVSTGNAASVWAVASWSSVPSANAGIIHAAPAGQAFGGGGDTKTIGMWVSNGAGNQIWGRGVEAGATQRNISMVTGTSVNTFYSFLNHYNGAGTINQYVNDGLSGNVGYNNTLQSWSDFGIGRQASESWNGDIAEVIAYNVAVNSAQRIIVNNYLAAKYNLTLSANDVYTMDDGGNGNYDYEVAGIGRVDASNIHSDARGSGIVRILNPTDLGNNEFFMWGHDNGTLSFSNGDVPAGVTNRFNRLWRVSEMGEVGAIDLQFDLTGVAAIASMATCDIALSIRLLVDTDNDGVFNDQSPISGATNIGGNVYRFANVSTISNNMRFTVAIALPTYNGPGGVGGVSMWWRADTGITTSGGAVTTWADQSGAGNNLTGPAGFRPVQATSAAMNNQPVVRYSGAEYFTSGFSGPGGDNLTLFMAANGSNYQSLFRFQNTSGTFAVYPWGLGGNTFISSSDGGTGGGIASGLVNSVNNIGGARYRRNTTNGMQTYLNGQVNAQRNSVDNALPVEPFFSGRYNPGASEYPNCDVGELIFYSSALNSAQMVIVQNYLSAKFNVALAANDVYIRDNPGQGNFDYDVAGIGRVDASNIHADSRGTGIVRISNPSNLDNNEFLMWGHDNGSLQSVNTTDVPATVQGRLNRVWRVSEASLASGAGVNVGNVDIQFDLSGLLPPITASDLRLLIDDDGDGVFNEAGTILISGAMELACGNYLFSAVPGGNITNGDRFTIGSINLTQTPLPVTLTSFSGNVVEGDALLDWSTASELNNDFFTVERSFSGKDFLQVGQVDGAGTTKVPMEYQFVDRFVPYGRLYYRIKQTDFDGHYAYSGVITVENEPVGTRLIVLPNPSQTGQTVRVRVASPEFIDLSNARVTVSNLTGSQMATVSSIDEQGDIQLHFQSRLASGLYIVMLRSAELATPLYARLEVLD